MIGCRLKVNLVYPYAETADCLEFRGGPENIRGDMGFGADPENMDILYFVDQILLSQGLGYLLNLRISLLLKVFYCEITDIFQEEYAYFFFWVTSFVGACHTANITSTLLR